MISIWGGNDPDLASLGGLMSTTTVSWLMSFELTALNVEEAEQVLRDREVESLTTFYRNNPDVNFCVSCSCEYEAPHGA